ncbi:hypothetical protein ES703_122771 [subsurface metagenome]
MKQVKKQKQVQPTDKKAEESLTYTVEVRDKEGRVIQRVSAPSRSYVEQWNQLVNVQASQANKTIKDTGGVNRTIIPHASNFGYVSGIGDDYMGIVVGKGTTAVAIDDYALESQCVEGTGIDEFNHQATTLTLPAVVGPTSSFTARRILINNSGASISGIREIGAYMVGYDTVVKFFLAFRDVLPSAVYVPHGGSITVTYTIAATV